MGSLPPSDFPELLAVPAATFTPVGDAYPGVTAFETRAVALGADRRLIVTHAPNSTPGSPKRSPKPAGASTSPRARFARGKTRDWPS